MPNDPRNIHKYIEYLRRLVRKLGDTEKPPTYSIDTETRQMVEAALNMVAQASSMQIQEESAESLIALCDAIADRFGIDSHDIEVRDGEHTTLITVYETQDKKRPKLTVIDGDKTPDDDTVH